MKTRRARVVQRLGVIAAATIVVGSYFTGVALAAEDPGGSTPPSSNSSSSGGSSGGSLVKTLEDAGLPDVSSVTDGLDGAAAAVDPEDSSTAPAGSCTGGIFVPVLGVCIPTTLPGLPGTSTTSPTGPSGSNTQIIYSPYPYPVFAGDYGHRYYGRYYDKGCGCDRYAAPTYNNTTVVKEVASSATQVSSVPKGGVDTGDGSFQ